MGNNPDLLRAGVEIIRKDFSLAENEIALSADNSGEQLRKEVTHIISWLLDNDYERLLNILYRIDIDEEKLKQVLQQAPPTTIPEAIANMVIDRELQKAAFRLKYRQ